MLINKITSAVIHEAINIHQYYGPGLLESVYEIVLFHELKEKGLEAKRQVTMPFHYKGKKFDKAYTADIIVEKQVILEIKSQDINRELHRMQLLSYLKISNLKAGLVLNFGLETLKDGVSRVVNNYKQ